MAAARDVVIAGAGIGGLTAALTLTRAGLRATVLEQAPQLETAGAGIQLSPNATKILIALGLGERLKVTAVEPEAIRVMSGPSAREIVRIPLGRFAENRYGAPYWLIHRADLQAALADSARYNSDITLKLGARVEDFAAHKKGVSVLARYGGQLTEEKGIALIGADGLWSTVRERLRRQRRPRFTHRTAWRALIPADHLAPQWRELGWSGTGEPAEVLRRFARWSWAQPARDIVAAPERWQKWALFERPAITGSGTVALLGDAAHPLPPFLAQGGAMAIEDAAVLASSLAAHTDDPARGIRDYERARKKRIARALKTSRKQGRVYGLTGPEAWIRNVVMRQLGSRKLLYRYDWLFNWAPPVFDFADRYVTQIGGEDAEG